MNTAQNRHPQGRPTGGQFAGNDRTDGDVTIDETPRHPVLAQIDKLVNDVYPYAAWLEFEDYADSGGAGTVPATQRAGRADGHLRRR